MRTPARHILTHQFWEVGQGCGEQEPKRAVVLFPVGSPYPQPTQRRQQGRGACCWMLQPLLFFLAAKTNFLLKDKEKPFHPLRSDLNL